MIRDRIDKMSVDILEFFESNDATSINLLCVLKGGFKFASDLSEEMHNNAFRRNRNIPIIMDFVVANKYANDDAIDKTCFNSYSDLSSLKNKDVLIVEDLVVTGKTLNKLVAYVESFQPRSVHVACLLVKRRPDCSGFQPDFVGFEIPNLFVVGYAIDYNDFFRDVPHVCVINNEEKKNICGV
ncbi:unnamed protein product [Trichobilharzia szidati]|nr:unnamed protein product [Trichobilharzia szidati]